MAPETCEACLCEDVLEGTLQSAGGTTYPIVAGILRILDDSYLVLVKGLSPEWRSRYRRNLPATATDFDRLQMKTATAFAEEWQYFSENLADYDQIARCYFDLLAPDDFSGVVLDAGCGTGRWARKVAGRGQALVAVDLSSSVDVAAENVKGLPNTHVLQADLHKLPFRPKTFDLIYSLGVLHHLPKPQEGLESLVKHLKPHGRFLGYFYYALDNRPKHFHALLPGVTAIRWAVSHLPHRSARWVCYAIALFVYWPLVQLGNLLCTVGLKEAARQVPLHEFYTGKSFRVLFNDSVDRFTTLIEYRFSRHEIQEMLSKAGLRDIGFSDTAPYWKVRASQS